MGTLQDGNTTMMTRKTLILILAAVVALAAARPDVKDLVKDLNELEHDVALITKEIMLEEETDCTRGTHGSDRQTGRCVVDNRYGTGQRKWSEDKGWNCDEQGSCNDRWKCCVRDSNIYKDHNSDYRGRRGQVQEAINEWEGRGQRKRDRKRDRPSYEGLEASETGQYGNNKDAYNAHKTRIRGARRR